MTEMNNGRTARSFGDTVAADLASGRAVDLAELYALDAVTDQERQAIEEYISAAPDAERTSFFERVRQARETLSMTFQVEEEPPADLFSRIAAQLPAQQTGPDAGSAASPAVLAPEPGDELAGARRRRDEKRANEQRRPGGARRWLAGVLLPPLVEIIIAVALLAFTAMMLGLVVSALVRKEEVTMPLLVLLASVQVVFCGALLQLHGVPGL